MPVPNVRWGKEEDTPLFLADALSLSICRVAAFTFSHVGTTDKAAPTATADFRNPRRQIVPFVFIFLFLVYNYFPIVSFTVASREGISRCCGHFAKHSPQATHEDAGSPRCTGDIDTV